MVSLLTSQMLLHLWQVAAFLEAASGSRRKIHEAIWEATIKHVERHVLHFLDNNHKPSFHLICRFPWSVPQTPQRCESNFRGSFTPNLWHHGATFDPVIGETV